MSYRRFSKKELEEIAAETRTAHGRFDGRRLLVEYMVEKLGFELIPQEGLRDEMDIEAYLPKRKNTIIVDQASMDMGTPRYYFTLTEEIAHSLIHLKPFDRDRDALARHVAALTRAEYQAMERDAKYLAGAILMPRDEFSALFHKHSNEQKKALGARADRQTVIIFAIRRLYMAYHVSFEAASYRAHALSLIQPRDLKELGKYRPAAFSRFRP